MLPPTLEATYSEWQPGIDPIYPDSNAFRVSVETPEGPVFTDIEDPAFIKHLEKLSGRSLRIHHTQRGQFDARPVSLISTSAIAKIGDHLELKIDMRDPRCKVITLDPDTAEQSQKLLRYLAGNHQGDADVFAVVLKRGRVNKGDPVVLA